MTQTLSRVLGGSEYSFQTGLLAQQCNGSVVVTCGGTSVLATATMSRQPKEGIDFLPLMVNYQEKFYSVGKILGSRYTRREARPPEDMTLAGRLIDRQIRPLFPKHLRHDIQVMVTVLSYDGEHDHVLVGSLAASAALAVSDIPWDGPTASVRVGLRGDSLLLNPPQTLLRESQLDLVVASSSSDIVMIEAGASEVSEEKMLEALEAGKSLGQEFCSLISELQGSVGKPKQLIPAPVLDTALQDWLAEHYTAQMEECIYECDGKLERFARKDDIRQQARLAAEEVFGDDRVEDSFSSLFEKVFGGIIRQNILSQGKRIRGRGLDEIRDISSQVGVFPALHGTGLFQRGETQGLSVLTLGPPGDEQILESINGEEHRRYIHHYNFPPYSVGEVSPRLSTGNREIGHGSLAQRALEPVLPAQDDFPYIIRIVTEILQSNGSSSMAAVCGSTLALMDGGVPISAPVAGIAMGLMTDQASGQFAVLTDLQDEEDFGGDMDFKVAGTAQGITAIQMDVKIPGISLEIFRDAFQKARLGRLQILESLQQAISEPRSELSPTAPRIQMLRVDPSKIGMIIGKGGETIQGITADTGTQINIEDDGAVAISGPDAQSVSQAVAQVEAIVEEPEVGKTYMATVKRVEDYGAFAEFLPGKQGLIHISLMASRRIQHPSELVAEGDSVPVRLVEIDDRGRVRLSMKDVD